MQLEELKLCGEQRVMAPWLAVRAALALVDSHMQTSTGRGCSIYKQTLVIGPGSGVDTGVVEGFVRELRCNMVGGEREGGAMHGLLTGWLRMAVCCLACAWLWTISA